jgi:hypothetical protein
MQTLQVSLETNQIEIIKKIAKIKEIKVSSLIRLIILNYIDSIEDADKQDFKIYFDFENRLIFKDCLFSQSKAVKAIESKYGMAGYGLLSIFIEILCEFRNVIDVTNEKNIKYLGEKFRLNKDETIDFLTFLLQIQCLTKTGDLISIKTVDRCVVNV